MDYWIELLCKGGIADILINLHYLPGPIKAYVERCRYPVNMATVYEDTLLGTAGTLCKNREFFRGEPVMLIHADNLSLFDVLAFVKRFETRADGIDMTMMTFRTDAPETCGIVEIDATGVVSAFHEKVKNSTSNLANAAVYILSPQVTEFISNIGKEVIDFSTEVLPHFLGRINTYHNDTYHRDIGTIESLSAAQLEYSSVIARPKQK